MNNQTTILNTTILTVDGEFKLSTITLNEAKELCSGEILSAVGHEATADILTTLLGKDISLNRILFSQEVGQKAVCFKLNGRPKEGEILSKEILEKIGFSFKLLERIS